MTSGEQSFHDANGQQSAERIARNERIAKENRIILSCVAAYIIIGFLTFGYAWNHPSEYDLKCEEPESYCLENVRGVKSAIAGVLWPIWGTGTFAIAVTRWP